MSRTKQTSNEVRAFGRTILGSYFYSKQVS